MIFNVRRVFWIYFNVFMFLVMLYSLLS